MTTEEAAPVLQSADSTHPVMQLGQVASPLCLSIPICTMGFSYLPHQVVMRMNGSCLVWESGLGVWEYSFPSMCQMKTWRMSIK